MNSEQTLKMFDSESESVGLTSLHTVISVSMSFTLRAEGQSLWLCVAIIMTRIYNLRTNPLIANNQFTLQFTSMPLLMFFFTAVSQKLWDKMLLEHINGLF